MTARMRSFLYLEVLLPRNSNCIVAWRDIRHARTALHGQNSLGGQLCTCTLVRHVELVAGENIVIWVEEGLTGLEHN